MSFKITTLNTEHGRHLNELFAFVGREQPDLLCLQEVFAADVDLIQKSTGLYGHFQPTCRVINNHDYPIDERGLWGVMILYSPSQIENLDHNRVEYFYHYYGKSNEQIPDFEHPTAPNSVVQLLKFGYRNQKYLVANTHFTWSANGQPSQLQRRAFARLSRFLSKYPELILCGDFNTPRGGEIFNLFTQRFTDNIPADITSTIDSSKHYSGKKLDLVVDNIFTTAGYRASSVRVIAGVSDHCAVVGEVAQVINCSPRSA